MSTVQKLTVWNLNNRKPCVSSLGSGQKDDDVFFVRLRWSEKLGMQLNLSFKTKKEAEDMIGKIVAHGKINTDKWTNSYYPSSGWESRRFAD